ncbi:MAG TPA: hypothetical protein VMN39_07265 [Longimicrobiaceae bacterium]|nr:hypothetical protein [Longimicrobiaceae bacterium]
MPRSRAISGGLDALEDLEAPAHDALLRTVEVGTLLVAKLDATDVPAIRSLLEKYRDLPSDLADASVVHVADRERIRTVFTLDGDFHVYRLPGGERLDVIPETGATR